MTTARHSPPSPRPEDPLTREVSDALARVAANYDREGSGPGSRFEGRLLEDVQAEQAVRLAGQSPPPRVPEPAYRTAEEARVAAVQGWNLRCSRCGSYGATWMEGLSPGLAAMCPPCRKGFAELQARHRQEEAQFARVRHAQDPGAEDQWE